MDEFLDFDADAAMAAQYLSDHDAESFPEDHVVEKPKEPVRTAQEQDELDRQSLIQYSTEVTNEASDYVSGLEQAKVDKAEEETLSHMFAPGYDEDGKKVADKEKGLFMT